MNNLTQKDIDTNLLNFNLTQEDLNSREALEEVITSVASVVVDDFAKNYLLNNPNLSIFLTHTDSARLLKNIKEFIVFIFKAPVDTNYISRVYAIGTIHYTIGLKPAKVSYGFLAIKDILAKMYDIDNALKQHRFLISKILSFVEYYMNKGYYLEKTKQGKTVENELQSLDVQMELLRAVEVHKDLIKKVNLSLNSASALEELNGVQENPSECTFGLILHKLIQNKNNSSTMINDLQSIHSLHSDIHMEFIRLKMAIEENNTQDIDRTRKNLNIANKNLERQLNIVLNGTIESAHIAISCAMKAIHSTTELFYKKNYSANNVDGRYDEIKESVEFMLLTHLGWAIDKLDINLEVFDDESIYDLTKLIRYMGENFYIGVKLSDKLQDNYILEIISLLLKVLDLHFSVNERELSLISFADKAETANKSKDMFLANMSHELRTPLNAISGFSQILLSQNDLPEASKNFVNKIYAAGNHLLELVNTILDFAKLESGKMQFKPILIDISGILNEVQSLISPLAQNKNITLKMPNVISLNLYIDPNLFKQALINLLTNAVKFTKENGNVLLNLTYNQETKQYIFEVKDNGIGLSQDEIKKLFNAFSQVDNSYKKDQTGTGLGLMITKTIVEELHKGKIWVESVKDIGSSFFISLPTPTLNSKTYEVNEAPDNSTHILIVEDTQSYQNILIENLKQTHKLTITDSVNKAKNLLLEYKYDFAIFDYFLIDGICSEILNFMEEEHIDMPSIVISAEDDVEILPSLSGTTNLQAVMNKKNIEDICNAIIA